MNSILNHRNRRDFSEFLLHHVMTMVLISYSYFTNFLPVGAAIMLVMDFSDIFVALFKMVVDVKEKMQDAFFIMMLVSWAYIRIYFYPVFIVIPFY